MNEDKKKWKEKNIQLEGITESECNWAETLAAIKISFEVEVVA